MLIGVAGMVGTGKTTLSRALGERYGLRVALESVGQDNPWLDLYYDEPGGRRRYGLELQLHFLADRMRRLRQIRAEGGAWVVDRTFYEDAEVFTRGLYDRGELSPMHWTLYRSLYDELCQLPAATPPTLLIYLWGPLELVVERIRARGRPSERAVDTRYWEDLQRRYELWIERFDLCPVLRVDVRSYDVVEDATSVGRIVRLVRERTGIDLDGPGSG